jgi:hypothetical protein
MWMTLVTTVSKAIGDTTKSIFNYFSTVKEKQSETEIIKDKRNYKKATNIAEEIFEITDMYIGYFSKQDKREYRYLMTKFKEKN